MTVSEKIKIIDNKIKQSKAQHNLGRETAKISALSSGNVHEYEFLIGKDVLPQKDLLEKVAILERFEYSPLGKELKAQTDIAKKQYQGLDKVFISNKDNKNMNEQLIKKEKKKYNKSNLIYNRLSFYSYSTDKKFDSLSFESKYSYLLNFYENLQKIIKMKPTKLGKIKEKVYNIVSELYNKRFEKFYNEYNKLSDAKRISSIKNSSL